MTGGGYRVPAKDSVAGVSEDQGFPVAAVDETLDSNWTACETLRGSMHLEADVV